MLQKIDRIVNRCQKKNDKEQEKGYQAEIIESLFGVAFLFIERMMNMAGRPNKWDEIMDDSKLILVEGWKRDGLSDEQVAKNLGVSHHTLIDWKKDYPEFMAAIKKGKEVSDYELENMLHKRAVGYYYTEEMVTNKGDVVQVTKYEHPNPSALIFALKNRLPLKYRDKQNIEHSGEFKQVVIIDDLE
jgi:hypothetical protein